MAKFPIIRQDLTVSGRASSVRGNIDTDVAAGAVGKAIGQGLVQLGGQALNLWKANDIKTANTQFSKYQRDVEMDDILLQQQIGDELDPEKHKEIHTAHAKTRTGFMPENQRATEAAELWNNKREAKYEAMFVDGVTNRTDDNWYDEAQKQIAVLSRTGSEQKLFEFKEYIKRRQIVDPLDKTEATKLIVAANKAQTSGIIGVTYRAGDYETARDMTEASSMTPQEKESTINTINAAETRAMKLNEGAIETELKLIDDVLILPQTDFLASVEKTLKLIDESIILPVKGKNGAGKEGQRKKIKDRVDAIRAGKTDPINQFDPDYYNYLSTRISKDPRSVPESEINLAVGRGVDQGITAGKDGQQGALLRLKRFLQDDEAQARLYVSYSDKLNTLKASKVFHQTRKKNNEIAADVRILLNQWATAETRTIQDYETFFNGLMDTVDMSGAAEGLFWRSREAEQEIVTRDIKEYVAEQLGEPRAKPKKGDTDILNGETWTWDGKRWKK